MCVFWFLRFQCVEFAELCFVVHSDVYCCFDMGDKFVVVWLALRLCCYIMLERVLFLYA